MQEKQAPKRPNSSDKSPESKAQQPSPSGTRSPGRPPKMRIDSINIPTDLELDERFIEFRELTGATEAQALLSVFALYKYAARHRAADADLSNIKPKLLAKRCYWPDSNAEIFLEALVESEILTKNLHIADWLETQPHATRRSRNLQYQKKQRDAEFKTISDNYDNEIPENGVREDQRRKEKRRSDQIRERPDSEKRLENAEIEVNVKENLISTVDNLAKTLVITDPVDYTTTLNWMQTLLHNSNSTTVLNVAEKIKNQAAKKKIAKPVGYIITTIQELLAELKQEQSPKPDPTTVCGKCGESSPDRLWKFHKACPICRGKG